MPLQRYELEGKVYANSPALQLAEEFNKLIDHINALEARLSALEHPVERLSDEE